MFKRDKRDKCGNVYEIEMLVAMEERYILVERILGNTELLYRYADPSDTSVNHAAEYIKHGNEFHN